MSEHLSAEELEALRREIGPPTDRDRKWSPMVSAWEVRALLDERDALTARLASDSRALAEARERLAACERLADELDLKSRVLLRAALIRSTP